jgi:hypothetical protein
VKVYIASSWRNEFQPGVVAALREDGHDVYDFRHPAEGNSGFAWRSIDPNWQAWTPQQYVKNLSHPLAESGFKFDIESLRSCEACVYVMPCGVSASIEAGWAKGAGKLLFVYVPGLREPDLMVKIADHVTDKLDDIRTLLKGETLCSWCARGYDRVPSAVRPEGFVHLFTPHGRVRCIRKQAREELRP